MEKERLRNGRCPGVSARKAETCADFRSLRCPSLACGKSRQRTRRQQDPGVPRESSFDPVAEGRDCVHPQEAGIALAGASCYYHHAEELSLSPLAGRGSKGEGFVNCNA